MATETVEIKRENQGAQGEYIALGPRGERMGIISWVAAGNARIAEHTLVAPQYRGQGIAGKLVDDMVADARENGFKIVPHCSYVAAAFDRHPEWADLRA